MRDRDNNLHNAMGRLRRLFGEEALPRVSEDGIYRLVVTNAGTDGSLSKAENILSSIVLASGSASDAYTTPQVMLYGRQMVELLRPKALWNRIVQGVAHHVYLGRGRGMTSLCVNLVAQLYAASETRNERWNEWDRAIANLRFRFLARPQFPGDLIVAVSPGQIASSYIRLPEETEFRRAGANGTASEYWWSLDETLDQHRWQIAWAETGLDAGAVGRELELLFRNQPGLPGRGWEMIVAALSAQRKGPQKEQGTAETHSNIVS